MAPIQLTQVASAENFPRILQSISASLRSRSIHATLVPVASIFATLNKAGSESTLVARTISSLSRVTHHARSAVPEASSSLLQPRTQILAIPTTYAGLNAGPSPGTVVGIVLGAVGGFLLALYLLYTCLTLSGAGRFTRRHEVVEEEIIRRRRSSPRRQSHHSSHHHSSHTSPRSEIIEVIRSPTPENGTIIVEEEHYTEHISRRPSRMPSPPPETVEDEDIVEVIEEHSPSPPPPRRESRRESKRTSGFRNVDPAEFGGGRGPMRKVRK